MSKIRIMTDSASDISAADEKEHNITVLPFQISLGGKSYTSRIDFDNDQFYRLMAQCDHVPTTSQITPYTFEEIYFREAEEGVTDLILVLINSRGSATYDNSLLAIDLFFEAHPEYKGTIKIHSIDGIGYSASYGNPVVQAAAMQENGACADEIVDYLRNILPRRQLYFGIYDLKYAAKSGRIPTAAAFLGTKLNLMPVMNIFDHEITTAAKCRGEKSMIAKIVELTSGDIEPGTPYELVYGCDLTCLDKMAQAMTERMGYGPSSTYQIGAAVAANSGPRIIGVSFTRKEEL